MVFVDWIGEEGALISAVCVGEVELRRARSDAVHEEDAFFVSGEGGDGAAWLVSSMFALVLGVLVVWHSAPFSHLLDIGT